MRARPVTLATVLGAAMACKHAPVPTPSPAPPIPQTAAETDVPSASLDAASIPEPSARPPDAGPGAWIVFDGPPGPFDTPMHGGPPWRFRTPRLPAIARDGARVVLADRVDDGLAGTPNLLLRFVAAAVDQTLDRRVLLTPDEFYGAVRSSDRDSAVQELSREVSTRVARANAELDGGNWTTLHDCELAEPPTSAQPPCSMDEQHVRCGDVHLRYGRQTLTLERAHDRIVVAEPRWKHAPLRAAEGFEVRVRACISAVYSDDARRTFAMSVDYECQGGGDWCSVPPEWHVVRVAWPRE
jgi:hypothetical protein